MSNKKSRRAKIDASPKYNIEVISSPDDLTLEEYEEKFNQMEQVMRRNLALYSGDAMLTRIQRRGLEDILRARIFQLLAEHKNKGGAVQK